MSQEKEKRTLKTNDVTFNAGCRERVLRTKARLLAAVRISVMRVLSLALRTRRPPRFFLPVRMSGGGSALMVCALGLLLGSLSGLVACSSHAFRSE